jgi:hypothetical protein
MPSKSAIVNPEFRSSLHMVTKCVSAATPLLREGVGALAWAGKPVYTAAGAARCSDAFGV